MLDRSKKTAVVYVGLILMRQRWNQLNARSNWCCSCSRFSSERRVFYNAIRTISFFHLANRDRQLVLIFEFITRVVSFFFTNLFGFLSSPAGVFFTRKFRIAYDELLAVVIR